MSRVGVGPVGRGGGWLLVYLTLRVCEANREYLFQKFINGRGIQKPEELNGRGPKTEGPN